MQRVWYHGTNESSAHNICEHGIDFTKVRKNWILVGDSI